MQVQTIYSNSDDSWINYLDTAQPNDLIIIERCGVFYNVGLCYNYTRHFNDNNNNNNNNKHNNNNNNKHNNNNNNNNNDNDNNYYYHYHYY